MPGDPLAHDRVALVGHRRRALLAGAKRLLHLAHLGPAPGGAPRWRSAPARRRPAPPPTAARRGGRAPPPGWTRPRAPGRCAPAPPPPAPGRWPRRCPRRPDSAPTDAPATARSRRRRLRSASNAKPASFTPNVVGSACTPWVRPTHSVPACSRARGHERVAVGARALHEDRAGLGDLQPERGVEHVGGGEPVVHPAAGLAHRGGHDVHEGRHVVVGHLLALGDLLDGERRPLANGRGVLGGDGAGLGQRVHHGQLHLEPGVELALLGPDRAHLRARVALDQALVEDLRREHGRVLGVVHAHTRYRHPRGHLGDRQQRVQPARHRGLGGERHADHRAGRCGRPPRPGSAAARPAPAMITPSPRMRAFCA